MQIYRYKDVYIRHDQTALLHHFFPSLRNTIDLFDISILAKSILFFFQILNIVFESWRQGKFQSAYTDINYFHFFQYTSGLEVLACSFETDFSYMTTVLQLRPSLKHYVKLQQLLGGRWISRLAFQVYSHLIYKNSLIQSQRSKQRNK